MPDHIARGIDMGHFGLIGLATYLKTSAVVRLQPGLVEAQLVCRAHASGCIKQHVAAHVPPIRKGHLDMNAGILYLLDRRAQAQIHAVFADLMGEILDQGFVDEIKKAVARFDQCHAHVECGEHCGVFHADHARADHGQAAGNLLKLQKFIAVDHGMPVEGAALGPKCLGACRDQELVGSHARVLAIVDRYTQFVRPDETRRAIEHLDMVAVELMFQHVDLVIDGLAQARLEVFGGDVVLYPVGAPVKAAFAPARQVQHRLAQRLGRNRAGVGRHAAQPGLAVNHKNTPVQLARLDGRRAAGRAGADDDQVIMAHSVIPHKATRRGS